MRKLSMLFFALATLACSTSTENTANEKTNEVHLEDTVDQYSGENITPQVELDSGNNDRLEVDTEDTVSSAESINEKVN
jgi:hypothetical protein